MRHAPVCFIACALLLARAAVAHWLADTVESGIGAAARGTMRVGSRAAKMARAVADPLTPGAEPSDERGQASIATRCLLDRAPDLKGAPVMYFFSKNNHRAHSLGCEKATASFQLSDDFEQVEEQEIRAKLVHSKEFYPNLTTYVLIHGYMADWQSDPWQCRTKDQILNQTNANVFIVDWSGGAKPMLPIDYGAAVSNTRRVAELVADFLRQLFDLTGSSAAQLHLIGHSLGAHISGFIGYELGDNSVGRITALDPAGPCFSSREETTAATSGRLEATSARGRLSAASAKLVVALHTDMTMLGLRENCAHFDVYVNGGSHQPGCFQVEPGKILIQALDTQVDKSPGCSHTYGHEILDSCHSSNRARQSACTPVAYACESWAQFQAGACGFCLDNDERCTYAGLYLDSNSNQQDTSKMSRGVIGELRHYITSGASQPHCVFHYQVLVATARDAGRNGFRLRISVGQDKERSIEVENKLDPESQTSIALQKQYLSAMRQRHNASSLWRHVNANFNDLNLYTALLTFESQPGDSLHCQALAPNALCAPLKLSRAAHLMARSQGQLEGVEWLALNYMSAMSSRERLGRSQLFVRDPSLEGEETAEANEPGYYAIRMRPIIMRR